MEQKRPDDMRVSHVFRMSRAEFDAAPERFTQMSENRMREAIAHFIQHEKGKQTFDDHYVEKRIDLYVASPSEFWAIVHREAEEIALKWWGRRS